MSARFSVSYFSSCKLCLLIVLVSLHLCSSYRKSDDVLCIDNEKQALIRFKHNLIDEVDRLASWDAENSDCCRWAGIVCDNITGHVHEIHLRGLDGHCDRTYFSPAKELMIGLKQMLRGDLSSSLLELKQLKYLDLSCNDFAGIQIPSFIGSLRNLRYLNLSASQFGGIIPPQIGNLSELRVLSLDSSYEIYDVETLTSRNIQWLSNLRSLHHLHMSLIDLSKATDWFQVINTLPSLVKLRMSECGLREAHSHVPTLNVTSLSMLDLSYNYDFGSTSIPNWIFSLANLVTLDLSYCSFDNPLPSGIYSFSNLTSLESVHLRWNNFVNSPSVVKGFSSNLISLDISSCSLSSSVLDSLQNLTSLLSLDLSENQLTEAIPDSLGNLCNLREIDLSSNDFSNIRLSDLLQSLFKCKSPRLESLSIIDSKLFGPVPNSIGRLSSLKKLRLHINSLNGSIPDSIGRLSSLEELDISRNQLSGSLPRSIGQLSNLKYFSLFYNSLTGVVTEAHFSKLASLTHIYGEGNKLTLKVQAANWIPPFQAQQLYLNSWNMGPEFPLWLQSQRDLIEVDISNASISSIIPPASFWRSLPNLTLLDMSQNHIKGTLVLGIPASLQMLNINSNEFKGALPYLSKDSLTPAYLDLSNNFFEGTINHFICSNGLVETETLNLENNYLSGVIPECWDKWPNLQVLNLENNNFSGEIPRTMGSLLNLQWLSMQGNKISGRIPYSLMNLSSLSILQLGKNELVGSIPAWFGTKLTLLGIVSLRDNNLEGNIPHELCYLSRTQILDLAHNKLSGNIPRCFNNFSIISGKENVSDSQFTFSAIGYDILGSASLVMKGREDTYTGFIGLVMALDLSVNNLSGQIPMELTTLLKLKSLNLSRNQLTGRIPYKIGDLKALETLDLSMNKLSGELPVSLSTMDSLSNFNVSYNHLTGTIPVSTQLQSFSGSSFIGNKLCGAPLTELCKNDPAYTTEQQKEDDASHVVDWHLIVTILLGFIVGFWIVVAPLIVSKSWRIAYFCFWSDLYDVMHTYFFNMFCK